MIYNIYVYYSSSHYIFKLKNTDFMPSKCTAPNLFIAEKEQKSVEVGLVLFELDLDLYGCYHSYSVQCSGESKSAI